MGIPNILIAHWFVFCCSELALGLSGVQLHLLCLTFGPTLHTANICLRHPELLGNIYNVTSEQEEGDLGLLPHI